MFFPILSIMPSFIVFINYLYYRTVLFYFIRSFDPWYPQPRRATPAILCRLYEAGIHSSTQTIFILVNFSMG